jgi:predicted DCC family thiol-disulfide oxidoreductase YuxK
MAWKLYYDGGCNLCHASQLRAERWAKKAGQPLDVDILASPDAIAKGYGEMMVLEADGKVYQGADAWFKVMTIAPWYARWISWMRLTPVTRWIGAALYNVVAKYRIKWFGSRACALPRERGAGGR